jgi:hypothetical protein
MAEGVMNAPVAAPTQRRLRVQWTMAIGVVVVMTAVVVVAMVAAGATTIKAMAVKAIMRSCNLCLSLMRSQWLVPVQTGAVIAAVAVMAVAVVAISSRPMLHRKAQHRRSSQRLARSVKNANANAMQKRQHALATMGRADTTRRMSNRTRFCL